MRSLAGGVDLDALIAYFSFLPLTQNYFVGYMNDSNTKSLFREKYAAPEVVSGCRLVGSLSLLASMSIQGDAHDYDEGGSHEGVVIEGDL